MITVVVAGIAFWIGWLLPGPTTPPEALRLSGYQFIDPLLACNVNNSHTFPQDQAVSDDVQTIVNASVASGNLSKASVYFVDLSNGKWASVDPNNKFYPSSLGKIPIMMAYYEMAENDPTVLDKTITYTGGPDLNATQDIKPAESIVAGQTYTVEQLIEYMIQDSDNNAAQLLFNDVDQTALNNIYADLGIPVIPDVTAADADAITPQQISILFRVLYNGTYLSRDYSEKALELMSQSSFTQGIVAGIPTPTVVSHKLGLVGYDENGVAVEHELHDCGIVYAKDPYVLCVMTRGTAPLTTMEAIIANISQAVYGRVENGE